MTEAFSNAQLIALAIVPKISAVLSIAGSGWIILDVLNDKEKQELVYHRILFMFSAIDITATIGLFLTTWPMPRETPNTWGAVGNTASCEFQGFLIQLGICLPFYNAALSIFYCLSIRYHVSETRMKQRYEKFFHAIPIAFGVSTAIATLAFGLLNGATLWCWIGAFPQGCMSSTGKSTTTECTRGAAAFRWRWGAFYGPVWLCFFIVIVCLFIVWRDVKVQEDVMVSTQYNFRRQTMARQEEKAEEELPPPTSTIRKTIHKIRKTTSSMGSALEQTPRTWQVFSQSLFFVVVFYVAYFWGNVNRIYEQVTGKEFFGLLMMHCIFQPLQGFGNFLVYRRPQYLHIRRQNAEESRWFAIKNCLAIKVDLPQLPRPIRMPAALSLKQRLSAIEKSDGLSQRQRQLASLAEMGIIPSVSHIMSSTPAEPQSDGDQDEPVVRSF